MYNKYKDVVLTVYCNTKTDPQRGKFVDGNSYDYISPWYRTMKDKDLHGVIFYDNLSEEFIEKYQTDKIRFLKCTIGKLSINDERYFIYYNFLLKNKYEYVLLSDVSDVEINKNPFDFMKLGVHSNRLFIGMNFHGDRGLDADSRSPKWYARREWKIVKFNSALKREGYDEEGFKDEKYQIYNAGLMGGRYDMLLRLLSEFCHLFDIINLNKNTNMLLLNYIIRKYLIRGYDKETGVTDYIFSGKPFNSRYQRFEKYDESDCYLIHK